MHDRMIKYENVQNKMETISNFPFDIQFLSNQSVMHYEKLSMYFFELYTIFYNLHKH